MFLLDTNVVSELRKPRPHGGVLAWLAAQDATGLFISAITIGELQRGIDVTRVQDADRAQVLETWLVQVQASGQVLALDAAVCRAWARLMHGRSAALIEDAFIAATARVHRLTVATRSLRDFSGFEVPLVNPFSQR